MIDRFLKFENEYKLFNNEIRNTNYWHLIRFAIYNEIISEKTMIGQAHTSIRNKRLMDIIIIILKSLYNIILKSPLYVKEKDILFLNHKRRVKNGNVFECLYTDNIIPILDNPSIILEDPILFSHYKPIPNTNILYTDYIYNIYYAKRIFNKMISRTILHKNEIKEIEKLISNLNQAFKVNLDKQEWIKKVENSLIIYETMYKRFTKVINKINPKIIIQVVSYSSSRFVINKIASERNIPTIELQHGTMGKYHIAYNFAEKMDLPTFPDYIFTFGQFWKDNTRLPINDDKIKVVGWPYFENKVNEYKSKKIETNKNKKTILFISQGTIGKELSKIAVEISDDLNKNEYKIIYKLHPGEYDRWKTEYPWLINSNLEVIDHNQKDMHYYFAQSNIQIGVSSTAIFEGLGYGLHTIIVKLHGYKYTEELHNNSIAELAEDEEDIIRFINNYNNAERHFNIDYFWEANSLKNMINEIEKIIEMSE